MMIRMITTSSSTILRPVSKANTTFSGFLSGRSLKVQSDFPKALRITHSGLIRFDRTCWTGSSSVLRGGYDGPAICGGIRVERANGQRVKMLLITGIPFVAFLVAVVLLWHEAVGWAR